MAIKRRVQDPPSGSRSDEDEIAKRVAEFGQGGYLPESDEVALDPKAPVGSQSFLFRLNDYQKQLLAESARDDGRSRQKLLETIIWPELERRKAEKDRQLR